MKISQIGVLCYNLTSGSTSVIKKMTGKTPVYYIKAYPIFGPNPIEHCPFQYRASIRKPRTLALNNSRGSAPEIQVNTFGLSVVSAIVREADVICLLGMQGLPALFAAIFARIKKKPILAISQTMSPAVEKNRPILIRILKGFILKLSTFHIAQTPRTIETLTQNYRIPKEKITQILWDGGAEEFLGFLKRLERYSRSDIRKVLHLPSSKTIILFCGSLFHLKGIDVLIKAFTQIVIKNPDCLLIIVGPGGGVDGKGKELIRLTKALGIASKVRFTGPLEWGDLARFYRASDIFALPTRKDVWPKVLVEAGLAGLPLITTDVCGAAAYLVQDNRNGFVVPVNDSSALAEAIQKLADPNLREEYGRESKQIMMKYLRPDTVVQLYDQAILHCLAAAER